MKPILPTFSFILLSIITLTAQFNEILYPELSGPDLEKALVETYKPYEILNYHDAREYLYKTVYNENDSVSCVYTGHTLFLPSHVSNPIFRLSRLGSLNGIITEHTYPQSKGAEHDNPESDMHHLVPARLGANIARLNFPFGEIPDEETDIWLTKDEMLFKKPDGNLERYSEQTQGQFEPREKHKGNVARMIFYFYTMYREEAMEADPDFFEKQKEILCQWHQEDPVDAKEYERTFLISEKQEGKVNPFVLDCTLASRLYCEDTPGCFLTNTVDKQDLKEIDLRIVPNPINAYTTISFQLAEKSNAELLIFNQLGKKIKVIFNRPLSADKHRFEIGVADLPSGIYCFTLKLTHNHGERLFTKKILVVD